MRAPTILCAGWVLLVAGVAGASESGSVAVVSSEGEAGEAARVAADEACRSAGAAVVEPEAAQIDAGAVRACAGAGSGCKEALAQSTADRVLVLRVSGEAPKLVVTGWLFDAKTGEQIAAERRFCQSCAEPSGIGGPAGQLVEALMAVEREEQAPDTLIEVHTVPDDAVVSIGGEPVGVSGRAYPVTPGTVEVSARKKGYVAASRRIELAAGQSRTIRLELRRIEEPGLRPEQLFAWGALGLGAGSAALGITWIAMDGARFENGHRLPRRRRSLWPGVVAGGVGAGLLATSAYFFWRERRLGREAREKEKEREVVAVPVAAGWLVGLRGRF